MRKHHVFLGVLLAFIAGVAVASFITVPAYVFIIVTGSGLLLILYFTLIKSRTMWVGVFILALVLGMWRFQAKATAYDVPIKQGEKIAATFSGMVAKYPNERIDKTYLVLSKLNFENPKLSVDSAVKIRVSVPRYPQYQYGDRISVKGKVSRPENFADFDYEQYLAKDNILLVSSYPEVSLLFKGGGNPLKQALFKIRKSFSEALDNVMKEPEASLAQGLLLGGQSKMPQELQDNFRAVGLSHIVALSGFNITIIAQFLMTVFALFTLKREWSFWLACAGIAGFVVLTGAEASVVRAAVMGMLVLVAQREGRIYNIHNALALAAALMVWFNPMVLRFDTGFQLSFLATLGLVFFSKRFETLYAKLPSFWTLKEYLMTTLSAQYAVLPLIVYRFGSISLVAPFANILVLPFIPCAMLLSFIGASGALISPLLGEILALPASLLLSFLLWIIRTLARLPMSNFHAALGFGFFILYITGLYLLWRVKPILQYKK
jgi:competence protein ComEC